MLSYFLFLKTLLAFNVLLLLPLLAFVVGVQAAFPPAPPGPVPAFTGLELLTGGVRAWRGRAPSCLSLPGGTPPSPGAVTPGGPRSAPPVPHVSGAWEDPGLWSLPASLWPAPSGALPPPAP